MSKPSLAGLALVLAWAPCWPAADPPTAAPPKIDRARWEAYVRYAEGYVPAVKFEFEEPKPSYLPGFYLVVAHLALGEKHSDRQYYVTADGQTILSAAPWSINRSPFEENLRRLPKDGPSFGPPGAPVQIVLFSDFQCPFCSQFAKTIRHEVTQKYPDKVRVIFVDFPLSAIHPWARAAAESAHCLAAQNPAAFWAFHDWIFEHQKETTSDNLRAESLAIAKQNGVDEAKFNTCLDAHAPAALIDKDIQTGRAVEVEQTPTFFINGRMETGALPIDRLSALIDLELSRPQDFATKSEMEKCCEVSIPKVGGK